MRSDGKHVKKKKQKEKRGCGIFAWILFIIALCVALTIGGFILWVLYGEEGDGKADTSTEQETQEEKQQQTVTVDVSKKWSVPNEAFQGSNGYGRFASDNVKNKVSVSRVASDMGIDEKTKDPAEKKRLDAVERFLDGLYYESDKDEKLSNGDEITVYIRSKEDPAEIEDEANIVIHGIGEHKNVTVAGLAVKLTYNEVNGREDLIEAAVAAAKSKIKSAEGGHHGKIFGNEEKYDVRMNVYGVYLLKCSDPSRDDGIMVCMRLIHKYPDNKYIYWTKEGDDVYQYEMCHFMGLDSNTTAKDIKKGMKYDMYKYQNKVTEGFNWYRNDLEDKATYSMQQLSYSE